MNPNAAALITSILRHAAQAAPQPVSAQEFATLTNLPREDVASCVVFLCATGALQEVHSAAAAEIAFTLTPAGGQLARNPAGLERFAAAAAAELPLMDGRGNAAQRRAVCQAMQTLPRPYLMRLLFAANIAVFLWGLILAIQQKAAGDFINPFQVQQGGVVIAQNPIVDEILIDTGLLRRTDITDGKWWRLLTCCFVHMGALHLTMNMYAFWVLGQDIEWLWGSVRFAVIYLLAGFAGSCAALTTAGGVAGASGAICGLFGAQAAWLALNRRYLPPRLVRSQVRGLMMTGLLLVVISLAARVSGMGHLGGALAGAAAAVLLHYHRFGNRIVQVVCIAGLFAVAGLSVLVLREYGNLPLGQAKQKRDPAQEQAIMADIRVRLDILQAQAGRLRRDRLQPLLEQQPARRDAQQVRDVQSQIAEQRERFRAIVANLERLAPFDDDVLEREREAAANFFTRREELLGFAAECLSNGQAWDDTKELEAANAQRRWLNARPTE